VDVSTLYHQQRGLVRGLHLVERLAGAASMEGGPASMRRPPGRRPQCLERLLHMRRSARPFGVQAGRVEERTCASGG